MHMTPLEFSNARKLLKRTQKQMAQVLGTSMKAIHSYEQGWRTIPAHVERQVFFLVSRMHEGAGTTACWTRNQCPTVRMARCPAWEFRSGDMCWFINGCLCGGTARKTWAEKMEVCRSCDVMAPLLRLLAGRDRETEEAS